MVALIRWVSGAQRFTFLHTPDSEFYYSLGVFGAAVTDRAPLDSYYWTKLGIILPVRGLSELAPPLVALDVFHLGLLLLVAGAAYVVARLHWSRLGSCVAAAFAGLNTVVLGFIGDPYASGAALAGLSVLIAAATVWACGPRPFRWWLACLGGLTGAWLLMINPYALILGAAGCTGILLANPRSVAGAGTRALVRSTVALLGALVVGFGAFLALGRWAFPGLSWFASLREFLTANDLSSWAAKDWAWLSSETSLLVPACAAAVALMALAVMPRSIPVRTGAGLIGTTVAVAVGYKLVSASNVLEHSVYSSMLWPATLLGLTLIASGSREPALGRLSVAVGLAAPLAWIAAGHWTAVLSTVGAAAAAGAALLVVMWLLVRGRGGRVLISAAWPVASVGLALLVVLGSLFQVLQNGRPQDPTKLHRRVLYSAAFLPSDVGATLAQDAEVERWLIGATAEHEQLLVWNVAQTRSAASMQLWGPNTVGTGFGGALGAAGLTRVRQVRPNAVVVYAPGPTDVAAIRAELESEWTVAAPTCRTFPASTVPGMLVCILRLSDAP